MTRRHYANAAPRLTLSGSITSGALSLAVSGSFSGWPTQFPYFACLDLGTASAEIVSVTNVVGTTATIVRAQDGTAAIAHPAGATLDQVVVSLDLDEANAHVNASTGVHGVAGSLVGTSDTQTLTNKTLSSPVFAGTATGAGALNTTGAITTTAGITGGSLTTGGTVAATGAATAASFAANANGAVTGVHVPKSYATEAAATTAIGTPVVGSMVWLTAPTTGPVGSYAWNGTRWLPYHVRARAKAIFDGTSSIPNNTLTGAFASWSSSIAQGMTVAAGGITVLLPGDYLVSAALVFAGSGTGVKQAILLTVNGSEPTRNERFYAQASINQTLGVNGGTVLTLAAGDVVSLVPYQATGGALNLNSATLNVVHLG